MKIADYFSCELNSRSLSSKEQIAARFDKVADHLLKRCLLTLDDRKYLLTEIEFYYHSDIHPDPYVHRHPNQLKTGLWYFHHVGQDLTFGSEGSYGGILVRGMVTTDDLHNDKLGFTDGPVKTFDELFNKELTLDRVHTFHVELSGKSLIPEESKIFSFPRAGLYPQGREQDEAYFLKRYRYISHPWMTKAERHVIHLFLKYVDENTELAEKLPVDISMIRDYEKAFFEGQRTGREEIENILSGKLKMNVINKCRLLGWYSKNGSII